MKYIFSLLALTLLSSIDMKKIYTFSTQSNIKEWRIVNDDVMGGISESVMKLTKEGHGKFSGHVSLDNYGGFASVQMNTDIDLAKENKFIVLRVKGDGKRYEFRLKGDFRQQQSYVHQFATSGAWETIKLPINQFYPQFRGQILNMPNFNFESIAQVSFLIANKQEEDFELLIDWIGVE
jgi:NADH dehydrogenase [ubiquinone] 1 alpha subcomplex assembly factor 1